MLLRLLLASLFLTFIGCGTQQNNQHTRYVNPKNPDDMLIEASHFGDIEQLKKALILGANINCTRNGLAPIHQAVIFSNQEALTLLLESGANPNHPDEKQNLEPLFFATAKNKMEIMRILLRFGAKDNGIRNGFSPIEVALNGDNFMAKELLISHGFDINFKYTSPEGSTPLIDAILTEDIKLFDLLLKYGANINAQDDKGFTPLHIALGVHNQYMVDKLLSLKARTDLVNFRGITAQELLAH